MSQKRINEYAPIEVAIEINLPPAKITVRGGAGSGNDQVRFSRPLQNAIQALIICKGTISEALAQLPPSTTSGIPITKVEKIVGTPKRKPSGTYFTREIRVA